MLDFIEGLLGAFAGAEFAVFEYVFDDGGAGFEVVAVGLDRGDAGDDGVGEPALALDATDAGGAAAGGCFRLDGFGAEDLVEVEDGADIGVAGVVATDARRVGDHGLELGADVGFGLGEGDEVAVGLGHLAAVEAGEFGAGGEQDLRLGEDLADAGGGDIFGLLRGGEELVGAEGGAGGAFGFAGELAGLFEDGGHLPGGGFG